MQLTILEYFTYYGLKFFSFIIRLFPRKITIFFGKVLGLMIHRIIPIRKNVAKQNLKIAFPDKCEYEINQILLKSYKHFGMILMDLFQTQNFNKNNIQNIIDINLSDIKLLTQDTGSIVITGHIGSWEMILPIFGINQIPFSVVVQFQKNKGAQKFFNEVRQFHGSKTIFKGTESKVLLNEIQNGRNLGLASDQNAGKRGLMVPFFGKKASIPKGAAVFKIKSKASIFFCYCIANKGRKYKLFVKKIENNFEQIESKNRVKEICELISLDLENIIRKYPEQYFWFHRKWPKKLYKK